MAYRFATRPPQGWPESPTGWNILYRPDKPNARWQKIGHAANYSEACRIEFDHKSGEKSPEYLVTPAKGPA